MSSTLVNRFLRKLSANKVKISKILVQNVEHTVVYTSLPWNSTNYTSAYLNKNHWNKTKNNVQTMQKCMQYLYLLYAIPVPTVCNTCTYCMQYLYLLYAVPVPTVCNTCTYCMQYLYLLYAIPVPTVCSTCTYCMITKRKCLCLSSMSLVQDEYKCNVKKIWFY